MQKETPGLYRLMENASLLDDFDRGPSGFPDGPLSSREGRAGARCSRFRGAFRLEIFRVDPGVLRLAPFALCDLSGNGASDQGNRMKKFLHTHSHTQ